MNEPKRMTNTFFKNGICVFLNHGLLFFFLGLFVVSSKIERIAEHKGGEEMGRLKRWSNRSMVKQFPWKTLDSAGA